MIPFLGFAPDADPHVTGVLTDVENIIPTIRGFATAPDGETSGVTALAAACRGAFVGRKLDNTKRLLAGTATNLYEWSSGWSSVASGAYTLGADDRWRFAQFGNVTLAAAKSQTLESSSSGAFAAISGAPKAALVDTANGFVMVANFDDGTDTPDGWYSSAIQDETNWTPSVDTQCVRGQLFETPGEIRALRALGDSMVAYKERSMYIARYEGPPRVWNWQLIPGTVGAPCQEAVIPVETRHYFVGPNDFYVFDGAIPTPIGDGIKEWFFGEALDISFAYKIIGNHDASRALVYWHYPEVGGDGSTTKWVAFNYRTGKWGKGTKTIESAVEWESGGYTIDGMDALSATIDGLPDIPFDSPFWTAAQPFPAVFDSTHTLISMTDAGSSGYVTTGDIGDDFEFTLLRNVRLRYIVRPSAASMTHYYRPDSAATLTEGDTVSEANNRFDLLFSSRWHRIKFTFSDAAEFTGASPDYIKDGEY